VSAGPSLYRRHRPRTFADVVGQEHVVRTLSHAVERGQVHHAYLFVGSRGTGKTSMAKILAACLNCVDGPTITPCGKCDSCVSIANATSLDVLEMDAASNNSVDDIRELREKVAYAPVSGRHKVYILDEAHMLSPQAWNAFLKTLEEPPPKTIFVLATTEAQKVLPTVVDRCHRFDFGRPAAEQVTEVIRRVAHSEQIAIDEGAMALIARHATGSFRDALGTLEQLVAYAGGDPIQPADVLAVLGVADAEQLFAALDAVIARDPAGALRAAAALAQSGRDPGQVLRDLEVHGRELLTVQVLGDVPAEMRVTPDRDARLAEQARALSPSDAVRLLELVSGALEATASGAQPRIQLELVLVRAAAPEFDPSVGALLARVERLEGGGTVRSPQSDVPDVAPASPTPPKPAGSWIAPARGLTPTEAGVAPAEPEPAPAVTAPPEPAASEPAPAPEGSAELPRERVAVTRPPASGVIDLPQLQAVWPAVVEMIRGVNAMLHGALADARPIELDGSQLVIGLPAGQAFLKKKAEQEEHRRQAMDALRNVTGASLAIRYELVAADGSGAPAEPAVTVPLSDDELVKNFVEQLDAQEIDQESN
jgi:DNA polymerase-3 subunit gamma/tau